MRAVVLVVIISLAGACSHIQGVLGPAKDSKQDARSRVERSLAAGNYESAGSIIINEKKKRKDPRLFDDLYVRAINGLVNEGRKDLEEGDPFRAGKKFNKTLNYISAYPLPSGKAGISGKDLLVLISESSSSMHNEAIMHYRNGELDKAISLWEDILKFDPRNSEVKKALRTAKIQRKNLRYIE